MDKKILMSLVLFLSLSFFVSAQNNCTNSDGGINPYEYGEVIINGINFYPDACTNNVLDEWFCNENGEHEKIFFACQYGCENGACKKSSTEEATISCSVSPDGIISNIENNENDTLIREQRGRVWSKAKVDGGFLYTTDSPSCFHWIDYYNRFIHTNSCAPGNNCSIREPYCQGNSLQYNTLFCEHGCDNGVCLEWDGETVYFKKSCTDTDNGLNPYVRGKTTINETENSQTGHVDHCFTWNKDTNQYGQATNSCVGENCFLSESKCDTGTINILRKVYSCIEGCSNGACKSNAVETDFSVQVAASINFDWEKDTEDIENEEPIASEDSCNGCLSEENCFQFGHRKDGKFCSENKTFVSQLNPDSICENNWECSSNVCVSGKCIDEGFIQKILNWFKRLFGRN